MLLVILVVEESALFYSRGATSHQSYFGCNSHRDAPCEGSTDAVNEIFASRAADPCSVRSISNIVFRNYSFWSIIFNMTRNDHGRWLHFNGSRRFYYGIRLCIQR